MDDAPLLFHTTSGKSGDICVFRLQGPLTLRNLFDFQKALCDCKQRVTIVDLTESPYMDSAGLGAILNFYISATRRGGLVQLVGVNDRIEAMLDMTKANALIKSYPTVEAAEAAA